MGPLGGELCWVGCVVAEGGHHGGIVPSQATTTNPAQLTAQRTHVYTTGPNTAIHGSLPPSPADSGVSDVDPSSSSQTSDEESKIHSRLNLQSGRQPSSPSPSQHQSALFSHFYPSGQQRHHPSPSPYGPRTPGKYLASKFNKFSKFINARADIPSFNLSCNTPRLSGIMNTSLFNV
jgi:hypothetical protein